MRLQKRTTSRVRVPCDARALGPEADGHCVADIQSYYDSIDHGRLLAELRREIADSRVLGLIERLLGQRVMDTASTWTPEEGIPQGSSLGPLLANVFLHPIDKLLERGHFEVIRYADDLVIMCRSRADAQRALRRLRQEIESRGLTLHPEKTRVTSVHEGGFDFLGYHFGRNGRHPRKQSLVKLKDRVREITKRLNGKSLPAIIDQLNGTLRGWFEYFRHSSKRTFPPLDAWIRMRLRRIEQWRHRERGNGRGKCHYRWTNEYFASLGLFTMTTARAVSSRSPIGDH